MPLPPSHQAKGSHVEWPIGRLGEGNIDIHPGRINSVGFGYDDRGRQGLVAETVFQVTARPENGGNRYPKIRNILAAYLRPRKVEKPIEGLDDLPMDQVYQEAADAATTYLLEGGISLDAQAEAMARADEDFKDELLGVTAGTDDNPTVPETEDDLPI